MKVINNKILFFAILFCSFSLNIYANWRIIGDAVGQETEAILTQSSNNSQEFVYVGKLTNQLFKITDGQKTYIHDCGDNDPLEESIFLREESNASETGMRIRYVGQQDYFKATLTVVGDAKNIKIQRVIPPPNMYIMGGPFNNNATNWLLQDAVEMERDIENPFVFYYKGDIRYNPLGDERGSFKILQGRSWGENYHPDASGDVSLAQASKMRLRGNDNKWTIPADRSRDGYYEIKIDVLNLTISVENFIHNIDGTPRTVYIAGDAMSCGWNNENPIEMQKIEKGIFQWQGKASSGQFKFLQRRNLWHRCYVATSVDKQVFSNGEYDVVFEENYTVQGNDYKFVIPEEGEHHFTLNLNTMKLRVESQTTKIESIPADKNSGVKIFSDAGRLFLESEQNQHLQAFVFSIDGRVVDQRKFVKSTDIALPKGCYLVLLRNEDGEKITTVKTIVY